MARLFLMGLVAPLLVVSECRAGEIGVRHRIDATVRIDPASPLTAGPEAAKGWLSFSVRLSANSRETRYFGTLTPGFADLTVSPASDRLVAQTKIWEEMACHQKRGIPKVTVTLVEGAFEKDAKKVAIFSAVRQIGRPVPSDELTPGIKLPAGADEVGAYYAFRAKSRETGFNIDLKIYSFDCNLPG
jgi:hypothetical protein